jgi:hypothetical protein
MEWVRRRVEEDLFKGFGEVNLPEALARKYLVAGRESRWQMAFASKSLSADPRSKVTRRLHVHESGLQKAAKPAVDRA